MLLPVVNSVLTYDTVSGLLFDFDTENSVVSADTITKADVVYTLR